MAGIYLEDTSEREEQLYRESVQRELDEAAEALRAHEEAAKRPSTPGEAS